MIRRPAFVLGLMYGVGIGVAYHLILDTLDAAAHRARPRHPGRKHR